MEGARQRGGLTVDADVRGLWSAQADSLSPKQRDLPDSFWLPPCDYPRRRSRARFDSGDSRSEMGAPDEKVGKGTYSSSVATLSAMAMGSGVLALPRAFASCGLFWGCAFLCLFGLWVEASLRWVVASGRVSGEPSYRENAEFYFGKAGGCLVQCGQVLLLFGGIAALFVTVASLLPCIARDTLESLCGALEEKGSPRAWCATLHPAPCMPRGKLLLGAAILVFPLACKKSLHSLRSFASLSLGCLAYFFAVLMVRLAAALASGEGWVSATAGLPAPRESAPFWQGPPVLLMSLLCHTGILQLDAEVRPESKGEVGAVVRTVILKVALPLYAMVGVGGFLLCGPGVSSNILEDFEGNAWMAGARLMLGLMNLAKIAMAIITLRESLVAAVPDARVRRRLRSTPGRTAATAAVLCSTAFAAARLGSLSRVLALMGCTVGVLFSLCLPAALYVQLLRRLQPAENRADHDEELANLQCSLREPLIPPKPLCGHLVGGVLVLPRTRSELRRQLCFAVLVFLGGAAFGCLGLSSWLASR